MIKTIIRNWEFRRQRGVKDYNCEKLYWTWRSHWCQSRAALFDLYLGNTLENSGNQILRKETRYLKILGESLETIEKRFV